jgi:glycosyltransferase involved in cell wall biosynthesis
MTTVKMTTVKRIAVVVPARNEEQLISRCLLSVVASAERLRTAVGRHSFRIDIVVVADACTDNTATIARSFDEVQVIEAPFARVGAARAAGIASALSGDAMDPGETWIANTDADSVVPPDWLTHQLGWANAGCDLVVGTVRPDFAELTSDQAESWKASHTGGQALGHVHGANLGFRASTYLAAGGFAPIAEHEDVQLVERAKALGCLSVETDRTEVMTSGRLRGRTPGGYAEHLSNSLVRPPATTARP